MGASADTRSAVTPTEKKRDYDRALADCNAAMRTDPGYYFAFCARGQAHAGKGDYNQALADFNEGIKTDPKSAYCYSRRGIANEKRGDRDAAIADFRKALALKDKLYDSHTLCKDALKRLGATP